MYLFVNDRMCLYLQAQTPDDIDAIRVMRIKVVEVDVEDNYVTRDIPLISVGFRAMVDMMCFTGAYGHKSCLESSRTRGPFRTAFFEYALKVAKDKVDDFYTSWKEYRARFPVANRHPAADADGAVDIDALMD